MKPLPPLQPLRPARVEAFVLRCPIAEPVRTSFGTMVDRPASSFGSRTTRALLAGARSGATFRPVALSTAPGCSRR